MPASPSSSSSSAARALVFPGGDPLPDAVRAHLPDGALVIAADSGLEHAQRCGRHVDVVVGDLDSVDRAALATAVADGTAVEEHPVEKDATDLELSLEAARARGCASVTVVGGSGGRLDHFLANLLLLASPRFAAMVVDAWVGTAYVRVVRDGAELTGLAGSLCTLLALHEPARVTTRGMRYELQDGVLEPGSTRGVSNELVTTTAQVSVHAGVVLAIQPNALEES